MIPLLIAVGILCISIVFLPHIPDPEQKKNDISEKPSEISVEAGASQTKHTDEMLGVWVPFMASDLSGTDRSKKAFTDRMTDVMKKIHDTGANTVIFQVHPFCDALYRSELFPASHIISGTQGKSAGYDPLETALETAHKYGLHFHAWINPLRIKYNETPSELSENNPYTVWKNDGDSKNDRYSLTCGNGIYLNPAYPEVRKLIIDGARELVKNYDIDGIQIDDYFYPDGYDDNEEYQMYCKKAGKQFLTKQQWRCENINMLVSGLYDAVHEKNDCVFGISPQCNIDNDINMGADVYKWCSSTGYADYICPQVYVSETHPYLPYDKAVKQWREITTEKSISLYFGIALYKIGTDSDDGTWLQKQDNLRSQLEKGKKAGADGFILYSCESLDEPAVKSELKKAELTKR